MAGKVDATHTCPIVSCKQELLGGGGVRARPEPPEWCDKGAQGQRKANTDGCNFFSAAIAFALPSPESYAHMRRGDGGCVGLGPTHLKCYFEDREVIRARGAGGSNK